MNNLRPVITVLFLLLALQGALAQTASQDVNVLKIRVGRPLITRGPSGVEMDNYYNTTQLSDGTYRGFTANASTIRIDGGAPWSTAGGVVVTGPIASGPGSTYASCGLWIEDVIKDKNNVNHFYGMVHAEAACNYGNNGQTDKSMTIMESYDQGQTWSLLGQAIKSPGAAQNGLPTGEGDCTVVTDTDFHYMYCLRQTDWKFIVARAANGNPLPGSWIKYYNGAWSQAGVGGSSTALTDTAGSTLTFGSVSKWSEKNYVMLVSPPVANGASTTTGVLASFSSNRTSFSTLQDPLLMTEGTDFVRNPAPATELIAYPSVLGTSGGRVWSGGHFLLTYTYVQPNETMASRYLVFRDVYVSVDGTGQNGQTPQVGVELSRWTNTTTSPAQIWATTAAVPGNYSSFGYQGSNGYVMTQALSGMPTTKLEECVSYWQGPGIPDRMITNSGTCAAGTKLRSIGYVYQTSQPNTVPLYRCWSPSIYHSHFVSNQSNCEGLGSMEWLLGYALAN